MGKLSIALATILVVLSLQSAKGSEMTFKFGSPSFSGNGKSSHYLTIENIEKTRKDAIKAQQKADAEKLKSDAKNTPIAKFKANIESQDFILLLQNKLQTMYSALMVFNKTQVHLQIQLGEKLLSGQLLQAQVM